VYAFNSSGSGTLSVGYLTDNVTVPNNPIDITNTSDRTVNENENVYVDFDSEDNDGDSGTFSCNRNDFFSDFDTATGKGNWLTNYSSAGTYSVDFGVSDGYGSTDIYTMTITVNDVSYPPPVISYVNDGTASNNSVTIYWDTDISSDSLVKYGTLSNNILNLNNEKNDSTLVTNHYIVLTGLENNTQYYYVVNSTSAFDKSNQSDIKTFTTTDINDITPPIINDKYLSKTSNVKSGETLTVTINVTDNIGVTPVTANNNIDLTRRNATHWSGTVTADLTKKVDIIAYDAAGNTNTTTLTYSLYTSGSSGGGGGGGGGTSGEAFANIVCTETDRQFVGKDLNVKYNFKLRGNYVQHIQFTGLTGAGKVAAKVEILNHTSTIVKKDAPNIVFKNLNVWIGNMGYFSNNNIKDPTITFIVDRSWVRDNDIILNTISFYSYNDRTRIWEKMSTQKIGEDSTSYLFKASLPIRGSLGPMAISGREVIIIPTSEPTANPGGLGMITTPTQSNTEQNSPEITPTTTPVTWTGTWMAKVPGFQLLAALIPLITLYFISRRRD
jgi:PGF-pre-PGF domain-containing protein